MVLQANRFIRGVLGVTDIPQHPVMSKFTVNFSICYCNVSFLMKRVLYLLSSGRKIINEWLLVSQFVFTKFRWNFGPDTILSVLHLYPFNFKLNVSISLLMPKLRLHNVWKRKLLRKITWKNDPWHITRTMKYTIYQDFRKIVPRKEVEKLRIETTNRNCSYWICRQLYSVSMKNDKKQRAYSSEL